MYCPFKGKKYPAGRHVCFPSPRKYGFRLILTDPEEKELGALPPAVASAAEILPKETQLTHRILDHGPDAKAREGVSDDKLEAYYSLLWGQRARFQLLNAETSQIIAFKR